MLERAVIIHGNAMIKLFIGPRESCIGRTNFSTVSIVAIKTIRSAVDPV